MSNGKSLIKDMKGEIRAFAEKEKLPYWGAVKYTICAVILLEVQARQTDRIFRKLSMGTGDGDENP